MNFNIIDTLATYRRLISAPDAAMREAIFRSELVAPFAGVVNVFGGGDGLAAFAQWGMAPDQFASEQGAHWATILDTLAEHGAWQRAAQALERGRAAFESYAERVPLDTITFALVLADLSHMPLQRGYSGFGGIPGWIMTIYGEPDAYNLERVEGATVHELHHNVRFRLFPFNPIHTTVGEYMVAEGLAESFTAELYGADKVGYYVTDFDEDRFEETRARIGGALDQTGFNEVRGYIFGDAIAGHRGLPQAGVPAFAGYALGYKVVQEYLKRTGATVADATFVPASEIIAASRFFADRTSSR
ncbi:MAG: hypothetical protein H7Y32_16750 [Chloroflexales bacterium]|nr:hypothetical protein [Chloroflexales bacterium]